MPAQLLHIPLAEWRDRARAHPGLDRRNEPVILWKAHDHPWLVFAVVGATEAEVLRSARELRPEHCRAFSVLKAYSAASGLWACQAIAVMEVESPEFSSHCAFHAGWWDDNAQPTLRI